MIVCWEKILVLCAVTIRVLGREVCTYVEERETEGSPSDWQGYTSVLNVLQCKEFCSSTPGCTAAEYRSSSDSCVLYSGPTTRRHNADSTFLHRICKEVTSSGPPLASKSSTSKPTTPEVTATTEDQINRVTSARQVGEVTAQNVMTDLGGEETGVAKERLRRSSSTEPAPDQTVTMGTPGTSRRVDKSRVPASLVVKMLYASSTDIQPGAARSLGAELTPTMAYTSTKPPTRNPAKRKGKKHRTRQKGKKRSRKHKTKFIHKSNKGGVHSHLRKYLTTTTILSVTEQSTQDTTKTYTTTQRSPGVVEISKSISLNIPDTSESLRIKPDKVRKPETLVRVHMRTSRYRQAVSPPVEMDNRVAVPEGPRNHHTRRNCARLCIPRNVVQHNGRGLFLPLMRIHIPFMTPYNGLQGQYSRFRPRFRFRLPIRQPISQVPQMPYRRYSQYQQWQQPMRQPQYQQPVAKPRYQQFMQKPEWQQFRQTPEWQQKPQWRHNTPRQRQWRQPTRQQNPWQRSQWRHSWNSRRGIGPQHAAIAQYGGQQNPWANNFRRASLRASRTHQVAVIPGKRRGWGSKKRDRASSYKQTSAPITTTATTAEPTTQTTSGNDLSTHRVAGAGANLKYAIQNDKLNDELKSHDYDSDTKKDVRWQLKPHYNTYLLRLNLPLPITGYKLCYLRQQLPPPPKIIVIAFKPDGSFKVKSLTVHYPRRTCTFVRLGSGPPELHLPAPLVIFTGTRFASGRTELGGIYNATAPKAEYERRRVETQASRYRYTAVFNAAPVLRKLDLPIEMVSAVVGFDSARMGFIYRFTVRLPQVLSSRNIMLQERLPENMLHVKIGPKAYVGNSK